MQDKTISRNNFDQCIKCAICTDFCPVLKVLPTYPGPKHGGPDGERLRLKNALFFDANLNYCLNCKRCENVCPSSVLIADIIHSARERYGKRNISIRNVILANTDIMGSLAVPFSPIVNPILGMGITKMVMDKTLAIDHRRAFPKYAGKKFEIWFREEAFERQAAFARRVSFFHGCYVNYNYPQLGKDFVTVMNALGYGVDLLEKEKCCGVAMISGGLFDKARRNAAHNVGIISNAVHKGSMVLTTSSTCTLTIRDEYPGILDIDNEAIREHIEMAVRFIFEKIESGECRIAFKKDYKARSAYHVPCHMEKLGWSIFTRMLMAMIPGMEMTYLDSNCCGIAGTYGFKKENYDRSQAIGEALFGQIRENDPDFVICECETCKWQIEMSCGYEVKNPISVLAEAMDIEETRKLNGITSLP